ncbi:unnamed protein product, partial [marine sediment metagenome]
IRGFKFGRLLFFSLVKLKVEICDDEKINPHNSKPDVIEQSQKEMQLRKIDNKQYYRVSEERNRSHP